MRIRLRIVDCHRQAQLILVQQPIPLHQVRLIATGMPYRIEPRLFVVESRYVDHHFRSLVVACRIADPCPRIRIAMLSLQKSIQQFDCLGPERTDPLFRPLPSLRRGLMLKQQGSAYRLTWRLVPPPGAPVPLSPLETTLTQSASLSL